MRKEGFSDEFCKVCGFTRKHAIRKLRRAITRPMKVKPGPKPIYLEGFVTLLFQLWLSTRKICSKKLKRAIPVWLDYLEWPSVTDELRLQLLKVSPATMDRLLKPYRDQMKIRGISGTRSGSFRKTKIPIRPHFWDIKAPGHMQSDTVCHCGDSLSGAFGILQFFPMNKPVDPLPGQ